MVVTKEKVELLLHFAKTLHARIVAVTGGVQGVRDDGGLFNSISKLLARADRTSDPFELCAYSYREFSTRHHFNDGNKRFSHTFSKVALIKKGYHFTIPYRDAVPIIQQIAAGTLQLAQIKEWICAHSHPVDVEWLMEYLITFEEDLTK